MNHLEQQRHNCARTRNARLAAIHSFMHYVAQQEPAALALTTRVLAIPSKRFDRPLLDYLSPSEVQAILEAPAASTWSGQRDRLLWRLLYNTGARVSEIAALNRAAIQWGPGCLTVIALWLGHQSPTTTHHYVELDLTMKERALQKLEASATKPTRFEPTDQLLEFLEAL